MVEKQIRARGVRDENVLEAMIGVPRERFVPAGVRAMAFDDRALPIGKRQTISQPYIVAYMTAQLSVTHTCRVLEVGTGTGYQTAILATLAGHVYTIERIATLQERAADVLEELGLANVTFCVGDGSIGLPAHQPFDRIMVTAAASHIPGALTDQLTDEGVLVIPVGGREEQTIIRVQRRGPRMIETPLLQCRFVKLIGEEGWPVKPDSEV